jgi:uncharacterized protein YegP (UPF0339 family)
MKIETYRDKAGQWRWRMRGRNGRIVACSGEGYTRRWSVRRALRRVLDAMKGTLP